MTSAVLDSRQILTRYFLPNFFLFFVYLTFLETFARLDILVFGLTNNDYNTK